MTILTSKIYDSIVQLAKDKKTNKEIMQVLDCTLSFVLYAKRKIRSNGIILPINKSKGRPKKPIHYCQTCGQIIK